jgi:hypothetical protein
MTAKQSPMLKNGRSDATRGLHFDGCSCCNTRAERRAAKRGVKRKESEQVRRHIDAVRSGDE